MSLRDVILPEVYFCGVSRMKENLPDPQATMVMLINDITKNAKECKQEVYLPPHNYNANVVATHVSIPI